MSDLFVMDADALTTAWRRGRRPAVKDFFSAELKRWLIYLAETLLVIAIVALIYFQWLPVIIGTRGTVR